MDEKDDDAIEQLKIARRNKILKKLGIITALLLILGIIIPVFILILSIILMLAGVSALYDVGTVLNMLFKNIPKEQKSLEERAAFDRPFYEGIILSLSGLGVFFLYLAIVSMGWRGILGW